MKKKANAIRFGRVMPPSRKAQIAILATGLYLGAILLASAID